MLLHGKNDGVFWKPFSYQSQVSILGPVGYGPTTLPLRHSDFVYQDPYFIIYPNPFVSTFDPAPDLPPDSRTKQSGSSVFIYLWV